MPALFNWSAIDWKLRPSSRMAGDGVDHLVADLAGPTEAHALVALHGEGIAGPGADQAAFVLGEGGEHRRQELAWTTVVRPA